MLKLKRSPEQTTEEASFHVGHNQQQQQQQARPPQQQQNKNKNSVET